ncbi:MAG: glutamine--fructose-6-phosphate transaminase (isomerizing) [Holosporales bacterium]|jgi:glucosamine--fructose-6-phosphate aminotransferase (isomerizing)|nr:glutamine--fructose-6-phosphate transaminase (isomerizing) [Holosporales bacterium]
MCGIISVLSLKTKIANCLFSSLERLEYRGYDSAGIAYIGIDAKLHRVRSIGTIDNLKRAARELSIEGYIGVGHTRWATHGKVTEVNAHPHICKGVAIVHNGIVENYQELKKELLKSGYTFESETDTEVIAKLVASYIDNGIDFQSAFKHAISEISGTFAIVAIYEGAPHLLLGVKKGSPMAIGFSKDNQNFYIASDAVALSTLVENVTYLEEGDFVIAEKRDTLTYKVLDNLWSETSRKSVPNRVSLHDVEKNGYETFMLKEIFEEPKVIRLTFDKFEYNLNTSKHKSISIIACGTSYYAGLLAKYWVEEALKIRVDVEIASEFRYRDPLLSADTACIFISQSGETIDTLSALRLVKSRGYKVIALVNVESSSIAREADFVIKTEAGIEIGVASTKAFVAQILSMLMLCTDRNSLAITEIETSVRTVLNMEKKFIDAARKIMSSNSLFYIGRGPSYPVALEGALKMKELSYIPAEGYPAGEIKHGPIAIVDEDVYTVVIAPLDKYFEKTISNAQEILARNGKILLLTTEGAKNLSYDFRENENVDCIFLPQLSNPVHQPFCLVTAIHLLAYHTSKLMGYDVDKPRNLAKSVTVE